MEDLDKATLVANRFKYSFRIVTLDGDIINPGGSITGGSLPKVSGNLLNRKHRIEKLKKDINSLSKIQRDLEEKKSILKSNLEHDLQELKLQEERLQNANIEIIKIENEKGKHKLELKRTSESIEKYKDEISKLSIELNEINQNKKKLYEEIEALNNENSILKESIEDFMLKFEEEKKSKEEAEKDVTNAKIQVSLLENELINKVEKAREIEIEINDKIDLKKQKKTNAQRTKGIDNITNRMKSIVENINKLSKLKRRRMSISIC